MVITCLHWLDTLNWRIVQVSIRVFCLKILRFIFLNGSQKTNNWYCYKIYFFCPCVTLSCVFLFVLNLSLTSVVEWSCRFVSHYGLELDRNTLCLNKNASLSCSLLVADISKVMQAKKKRLECLTKNYMKGSQHKLEQLWTNYHGQRFFFLWL